ncbi:MAG: flagellar basal body P-ring protein FlgI, partial [Alphaproteobacteria bacterium]|nr:flagellar basal body P-ring protein FlgI [Alphaproteobacteria bacterium]
MPNRLSTFLRTSRAALAGAALGIALLTGTPVDGASRIKDIADFEGVRNNMLIGYGLVVGLPGTGDTLSRSIFTRESLIGMLERLGVNSRDSNLRTQNVAAVMVTATLPPFARQGSRIDVSVAAVGDSASLRGGTLLVTPLLAADGEVYAVAQGPVAIAGISAQGQGASVSKGTPTNGRIANGAIVERELGFQLASLDTVKINLRNPDLTTSRRIAQAVNAFLGTPAARSLDPNTVQVQVPTSYQRDAVALMTDIEQLRVEPDQIARVVIDENSGVIVMGENVRISTVAIAQGSLTIRITETPQVSQPAPFSQGGTTTTVART